MLVVSQKQSKAPLPPPERFELCRMRKAPLKFCQGNISVSQSNDVVCKHACVQPNPPAFVKPDQVQTTTLVLTAVWGSKKIKF